MSRWLDGASSVSMILAAAVLLWLNVPKLFLSNRTPTLPGKPVSLDGIPVRGSLTAALAIIEYSDFQCPFCARFALETLPVLETKYISTGKVLLAFKHFPLENIHPFAFRAAEAAECAHRQGKFWGLHDILFRTASQLNEGSLLDAARSIGLDLPPFQVCLDGEARNRVRGDASEAKMLALPATPAFLIGTLESGVVTVRKSATGALSAARFAAILDELLIRAR